ncbi:hypothetical protein PCE1_001797 [Barthelona sp. PCE]
MQDRLQRRKTRYELLEFSWWGSDQRALKKKEAFSLLSVHFHPTKPRFVTTSLNRIVVMWELDLNHSKPKFITQFVAHEPICQVARFSNSGRYVATGGSHGEVKIWQKSKRPMSSFLQDLKAIEQWDNVMILRGHSIGPITDASWSYDDRFLLTCNEDGQFFVWDMSNGTITAQHIFKNAAQGCAMDPLNIIAAAVSVEPCACFVPFTIDAVHDHFGHPKKFSKLNTTEFNLKIDKNLTEGFFRRPAFSPDGLLIACPSAKVETNTQRYIEKEIEPSMLRSVFETKHGYVKEEKQVSNTVAIFSRTDLPKPCGFISLGDEITTVVRFAPGLYKCSEQDMAVESPLLKAPYKMYMAICAERSISVYDTIHSAPLCVFKDVHWRHITDCSWHVCENGDHVLLATSLDSFVSRYDFLREDLGEMLAEEDVEEIKMHYTNLKLSIKKGKFRPYVSAAEKIKQELNAEKQDTAPPVKVQRIEPKEEEEVVSTKDNEMQEIHEKVVVEEIPEAEIIVTKKEKKPRKKKRKIAMMKKTGDIISGLDFNE